MDDKVEHTRRLCLEQAKGFLEAAEVLDQVKSAHIVYHLSLLALEEVGKAGMLAARAVRHATLDGSWFDRWLEDHRRKLHWAVWSPMSRLNPEDFKAAQAFAESAHNRRLASLYVDSNAALIDTPPVEQVTPEDARQILSLAHERLRYEQETELRTTDDPEHHELTRWFLEAMDDPERSLINTQQTVV